MDDRVEDSDEAGRCRRGKAKLAIRRARTRVSGDFARNPVMRSVWRVLFEVCAPGYPDRDIPRRTQQMHVLHASSTRLFSLHLDHVVHSPRILSISISATTADPYHRPHPRSALSRESEAVPFLCSSTSASTPFISSSTHPIHRAACSDQAGTAVPERRLVLHASIPSDVECAVHTANLKNLVSSDSNAQSCAEHDGQDFARM